MKFALILVSYCCCLVAKFFPSFFFLCVCVWHHSCQAPLSLEFFQARIFQWVTISFFRGSSKSEIKLLLMHWQADSLSMSHQGSPVIYLHINYLSVFYIIFQNISREFMLNILRNSCCQIQASASCDSDYYQMWISKNILYIYMCVCVCVYPYLWF